MALARKINQRGRFPVKTIARVLGVSRSNLYQDPRGRPKQYAKLEDYRLEKQLRDIVQERTTYGYRRATAMLNRIRKAEGKQRVNHKRIYRLMKQKNMLCTKQAPRPTWLHDGKVVTDTSDSRWCSDIFVIKCWNGEKLHVAFSLDCCDREIIGWVSNIGSMRAESICDLLVESVEARFGRLLPQQKQLQWLSDNGPQYTSRETLAVAAKLGLRVITTPANSPESNGMAESFVKTFKRDYVYVNELPSAAFVESKLGEWFEDYNENHPHQGLQMNSPREFRRSSRN